MGSLGGLELILFFQEPIGSSWDPPKEQEVIAWRESPPLDPALQDRSPLSLFTAKHLAHSLEEVAASGRRRDSFSKHQTATGTSRLRNVPLRVPTFRGPSNVPIPVCREGRRAFPSSTYWIFNRIWTLRICWHLTFGVRCFHCFIATDMQVN